MTDQRQLDEKTPAELEAQAADLRAEVERDPAGASDQRATLKSIEWELEKRTWRKP